MIPAIFLAVLGVILCFTPLASLLGRHREVSRYRAPIAGLYLSGAATYPGAGIFGAAGRNVATAVIHDTQGRGRWLSRSA